MSSRWALSSRKKFIHGSLIQVLWQFAHISARDNFVILHCVVLPLRSCIFLPLPLDSWIAIPVDLELILEEKTPLVTKVILFPVDMLDCSLQNFIDILSGKGILTPCLNDFLDKILDVFLESIQVVIVAKIVQRVKAIHRCDKTPIFELEVLVTVQTGFRLRV